MRFGILSDIHGNVWALEAVLKDAASRGIDRFINLGDILYGPLKPRETFELLQTIDAVTIQGNEDRVIYEAYADQVEITPTLAYLIDELGAAPIQWLQSLPKTQILEDEIFACHGIPTSDTVYLLEDVTHGFPIVKPEETILQHLNGIDFPVILCGHSHIPRVVRLASGAIAVNPGSVGVPAYDDDHPNFHVMQNYSPFGSYAILEKKGDTWQTELLQIPYNHTLAVEQAQRQNREDWAYWLDTGRVLTKNFEYP